jgi:hypothetical protein
MGSNSSSGGGGGGNNTIKQQKKNKFTDLTKENLNPNKDNYQKNKLDNYQIPDSDAPGVIGAGLNLTKGIRQKSFEVNRDYYQKNVAGKRGYKDTFDDYQRYITGRTQGKLDAMGRTITQSDNGGAIASSGQVVQAPKVEAAPTTAEVSQATTTAATEEDILLRKRRTKARGRSPTIMSGVAGVTSGLTLGKPSLLGS